MAHLPQYACNALIRPGTHGREGEYSLADPGATILSGPDYVLLRKEFLAWKVWKREFPAVARRILVTMGGSDRKNVTMQVLNSLSPLDDPKREVRVVIGPNNLHRDSIHEAHSQTPSQVHILDSPENMPELMAWADMAVSSSGGTSWEMAFMGLPSLTVVLSENQQFVAEEMEKAGCSRRVGKNMVFDPETWTSAFHALAFSAGKRREMSEAGRMLVDGLGVERVVRWMLEKDLESPEVSR